MATVNVSTWAELVSAIGSAAGGVFKTPVCRWEDKTYSFTLATPLSDTIPASSSEIEDTDYLIANGFDVVPSNI